MLHRNIQNAIFKISHFYISKTQRRYQNAVKNVPTYIIFTSHFNKNCISIHNITGGTAIHINFYDTEISESYPQKKLIEYLKTFCSRYKIDVITTYLNWNIISTVLFDRK